MNIKIAVDKVNYFSSLIFSCMNEMERNDEHSQSDLKYAFKKWQKRALEVADPKKNEYHEKAQDEFMDLDIKYGLQENNVLVRKETGKNPDGTPIMTIQYPSDKEAIVAKEKREVLKRINAEAAAQEVEFDAYIYQNHTRIKTFDPFVVEELSGVFFPEGFVFEPTSDQPVAPQPTASA